MSFFLILGALAIYLLPSLVAAARGKINSSAIFVLNVLLGWTVLGWIIALVWACTHDAGTLARESQRRATRSNWSKPFYEQ